MAGKQGARIYHTPRWKAVRRAVLNRDNWTCTNCGGHGRMEVDHIKPVSRGGKPFDMSNLRALCRHCHVTISGESNRNPPPGRAEWDKLVRELS